LYDDPRKAPKNVRPENEPDGADETCTANTDGVDREVERLKKQKERVEQQIRTAAGNEQKVRELEKELARIEGELNQKDNDAYRRQHAVIS